MSPSSIIGAVAVAIGLALLVFARRASNAPVDQVSEALTGRFTGTTTWNLTGGASAVAVGGAAPVRGLAST